MQLNIFPDQGDRQLDLEFTVTLDALHTVKEVLAVMGIFGDVYGLHPRQGICWRT